MTKIPIFLSILGVAGGVLGPLTAQVGASQYGLTSISEPKETISGSKEVISETREDGGSVRTGDSSVVANQNVAGLNFIELNFGLGQLKWEFQYEDDQGRTFSKYIMTSLDFWRGVTEAQADAALAELGNSDSETWTSWRSTYTARDGRYAKGMKLSAPIAWSDPLNSNQSDLIYYAIEYRNRNDPTVAPVWYRGKIDYRACAHSPNIEASGVCYFSLDPVTNLYNITPVGGTLSYDDEMAQLARKSYLDAARKQIGDLERRKQDDDEGYRNGIEGAEYTFNVAKRGVETMHASEKLASEIQDLEQRLAALKQDDSAMPDPDDSQGSSPDPDTTPNPDTTPDSNPEQSDNSSSDPNLGPNSTQNSGSDSKGTVSDAGNTTGSVGNNLDVGGGASEAKGDAPKSPEIASNLLAKEDIDDRSAASPDAGSEVELPKLGNEAPWLKRHLWVLALPIAVIILVIFILVKRNNVEDDEI